MIIFLLQVFLLLGLSRFGGMVLSRFRLPALTAEIAVGVVLGPTILGRFNPTGYAALFPDDIIQKTMFETVAWLGMFFFLMEAGLEIDFSSAWRQKSEAVTIAIMDIVVPMSFGFIFAWFLPSQYLVSPDSKIIFSLFMGTILTISAMPITLRALHDLNLTKTDLGFLIMSALSVNDIIGWLLFTVVFGFFVQANADVIDLCRMVAGAMVFIVFCFTLGRRWSNWIVDQIKKRHLPEPASSLTFIFLLGLWCGAVAQRIGLHALFGFFLAGVMAGEAKALSERTRQTISQMVYALFVPLFFAGIGLKMDFFKSFDPFLVAFIAVAGIGLRFTGAWLGCCISKVPRTNRSIIAIAHTPGGMMEIVMGLLALEYHLITPTVFTAVVFGALITAVVMGPWLSWAINRRKHISILEFFSKQNIVMPLKVKTRDQAIEALCSKAATEAHLDEALIKKIVLDRENLIGTAIEEGVALPHGRLKNLHKPVIVFGRSLTGIDWNSPDGKQSQFIFLILTPASDDGLQVQILRAIAMVMQDAVSSQGILNAKNVDEIWDIFQPGFTKLYIKRQ